MPKRIATPPPGDDEPRYLVVYKPYPLNVHWGLPLDRITFARWIACVVGAEDLDKFIAFYHKPTAHSMVLVEIDRTYSNFKRLLGEHKWKNMLQNPSDEEQDQVSRIFYSTYTCMRDAQKDGWLRESVEDAWFNDWAARNSVISYPYPETQWCPTPPEDQTNKNVCRPLPKDTIAPPPRVAPPVVGSAAWVARQTKGANPPSRGAWSRGRPRGGPSVAIPGRATKSAATSPVTTKSPASASSATPNAWSNNGKSAGTRTNGKPMTSPISATAPSGAWSMRSPISSDSPRTPSSATSVNYAAATKSETAPHAPPGLEHMQRRVSNMSVGTPASGGGRNWKPNAVTAEYDEELARAEGVDPAYAFVAPWEREHVTDALDDMLWGDSATEPCAPADYRYGDAVESWGVAGDTEVQDSLWGDDDDAAKLKAKEEKPPICKSHGLICKRGICKDYDSQMRALERKKKQDAPRADGNGKGGSDRGRNGWGRGRGSQGGSWRKDGNKSTPSVTEDGFSAVGPRGKTRSKTMEKPPAKTNKAAGTSWADDDGTESLSDADPWAGVDA